MTTPSSALGSLLLEGMSIRLITIYAIGKPDLTLPKPKKEFLKRSLIIIRLTTLLSFKLSGAMLWNQLSNEAKLAVSIP